MHRSVSLDDNPLFTIHRVGQFGWWVDVLPILANGSALDFGHVKTEPELDHCGGEWKYLDYWYFGWRLPFGEWHERSTSRAFRKKASP